MGRVLILKSGIKAYLHIIIFLIFCSIIFIPITTYAQSDFPTINSAKVIELKDEWQYRLGDSPEDSNGNFIWLSDPLDNSNWKGFLSPGHPPKSSEFSTAWVRIKLPTVACKNPCVYFMTNDQLFEVYFGNKLLYKYGDIKYHRENKATGSPLHIFKLPENFQNELLTFRMHTSVTDNTGLLRKVELGSRTDLILKIISDDIDRIILSCIFIFLGLCMIFVFLLKKVDQRAFLSLGFTSILVGVWIIAETTNMKQFFINSPMFWYYASLASFYIMPIGICSFVEQIFAIGKEKLILNRICQALAIFAAFTLLMDLTNKFSMSYFLNYYFILLIACIFMMGYTVIKRALGGSTEAKIFSFGLAILSLCGVYDYLGWYFKIIPWSKYIMPWGMLIFILSLIFILGRRFVIVYDKLKVYSEEIEIKNDTLNQMWEEVKYSRDKLAKWNKDLEYMVLQKTSAIKNILNNVGQGFLTFGEDLLIDEEYSQECVKLFNLKIENRKFSELIYPEGDERKYLEMMLIKTLKEKSESKRDIFIPLLPEELIYNGKNIRLEYKIIDSNNEEHDMVFMAILTDITDKRFVENKMEEERNRLKMVITGVTNYNNFARCIKDYQTFCRSMLNEILESGRPLKDISFEIYRAIHTFKGSFSQVDIVNIVGKLHDFETEISNFNKNIDNINIDEYKSFLAGFDMEGWLQEDLNILKDVLGEHFFRQETAIFVDQAKLVELEEKISSLLSPSISNQLLPELRQLRYKPFAELLKSYPKYVMKLSERFKKLVNPLVIKGEELMADIEKYRDFSISLLHVFRNIIDHGIEPVDERLKSGKNEYGNIACSVKKIGNEISLTITDDGNGVDLDKIRQKAVALGIYDSDTVLSLSDSEVINLILRDGFSTKENITQISGRGVGLASVKSELDRINGTVEVKSKSGLGTEFHFLLPFEEL